IDLYQFHWPDDTGTAVEDSWGEMTRLVEAGKVRAAGVSNFDVGLLERCEALRHVDSLQPPFSLIRREAAAAEIPWCAAHGTGLRALPRADRRLDRRGGSRALAGRSRRDRGSDRQERRRRRPGAARREPDRGGTVSGPAFLFDLDGTLVDSVYQHVLAWREALE